MSLPDSNQTANLYGASFYRLRAKLARCCGLWLESADRNLRRCSRYNDEEAWEGWAERLDGSGGVRIFSWQTVTDLLRRGDLTSSEEPWRVEIYRG